MNLDISAESRKGSEKPVLLVAASELDADAFDCGDVSLLQVWIDDADLDVDDWLGRKSRDCSRTHVLNTLSRRAKHGVYASPPSLKARWPRRVVRNDLYAIVLCAFTTRRHVITRPHHRERTIAQGGTLRKRQLLRL
jgi:hypothetical protein